VSYFSDGRTLNTTLWVKPISDMFRQHVEIPIYGLLIDADSNPSTGDNGIDYKLEVRWNDSTQSWVESLFEYSADGMYVKATDLNKNFTGISISPDITSYSYVSIPLNLHAIGTPNKFKVMFFAQIINKSDSGRFSDVLVDVSNWVDIPPPVYTYVTTPNPLVLREGDKEIIGAQLRSSDGMIPNVVNGMHSGNNSVIKWDFNPDGANRIYNIEPEPFEIYIYRRMPRLAHM
jgi:hypothetical protein